MSESLQRRKFNSLSDTKKYRAYYETLLQKQDHQCFYCKIDFCEITEIDETAYYQQLLNDYPHNQDFKYLISIQPREMHLDNYSIDHVVPLALGGTNDLTNLVLACLPCNIKKGVKPNYAIHN